LWSLLRWEGQCMGAVGEPRKRPHCLMCFGYGETKNFKIKNALFRECWTRTYELQRHRHAYRWGWHHVKAKSCHWRRQCGGSGSSPKAGRRVLPKAASSYWDGPRVLPDHRLHRAMHEPPCLELYAAGFDPRL